MRISKVEVRDGGVVITFGAETDFEGTILSIRGMSVSLVGNPERMSSGRKLRLTYKDCVGRTLYGTTYHSQISDGDAQRLAEKVRHEFTRRVASRSAT